MSSTNPRPRLTIRVVRGLCALAEKPPLIDARKTSDEGAALRWIRSVEQWRAREAAPALKKRRRRAAPVPVREGDRTP